MSSSANTSTALPAYNKRKLVVTVVVIALLVTAATMVMTQWKVWVRNANVPATGAAFSVGQVQYQQVGYMKIQASGRQFLPHRYTATLVARRTSSVSFPRAERISQIVVDQGDEVVAGQTLARQDPALADAMLAQAEARLNQAQAVLDELQKGPRVETLAAARAEVKRLQSQAKLAEQTFKRQQTLRNTRAISVQEFDAAKFDLAANQAAVVAAQEQLNELEAGTRVERVAAQLATVEMAKATVRQAKIGVRQTKLLAPYSGQISQRFVDEGTMATAGMPVLEIVENQVLEARFGAPIQVAAKLGPGSEIRFQAFQTTHRGIVRRISPSLDGATRTREIIIDVPTDQAKGLVAGQTVQIEFAIESDQPGYWVPSEALQPQVRGLWSVLALDTGGHDQVASGIDPTTQTGSTQATWTTSRRDVEVLSTWGSWSRIRGTIDDGDRIIVHGAGRISAGQNVLAEQVDLTPPWQNENVKRISETAAAAPNDQHDYFELAR